MQHIVYNPCFDEFGADSFVSMSKPSKFFNQAVRSRCNVVVHSGPYHCTPNDLKTIHSPEYVDDIFAGKIENGYGHTTLPTTYHSSRMCGVMVEAARIAAETCEPVCAPVQGFHHAHYDHGYGYCTFNGLIMAAKALRDNGYTRPIIILDCDGHHGDGTDNIIKELGLTGIVNYSFQRDNYSEGFLREVLKRHDPSMVFYQAGADSHKDDPFGVGYLSTEQMVRRDMMVFQTCKAMGHGVVWNLAGGYQNVELVLSLHMNTFKMCNEIYAPQSFKITEPS